ncbi:MAG TPA: hypothetical protein VGU71_19255, partial [Candidatus Dormibacteraeota bacterium]|nr:hypothetical protein [Candidatus Dormibacteraeota bacterium]
MSMHSDLQQPGGSVAEPVPAAVGAGARVRFDPRAFVYRYGLLVLLAGLLVFFAATQPAFATVPNLL